MAAPQLVQAAGGYVSSTTGSSTTDTVTLPNPPTAGNTLVLLSVASSGATDTVMPSGFTLATTEAITNSTAVLELWTKISDGTEQTCEVTSGADSNYRSTALQEWLGNVTVSGLAGVYESGASGASIAFGESTAPPSATALPSAAVIVGGTDYPQSFVNGYGSPWITAPGSSTGSVPGLCVAGYLPNAPAAAVAPTLSIAAQFTGFYEIQWWTDGTAASGPTVGTLAGDASFTASAASSILGRAALAGDASLTQSGSATLTGIAALLASAAFVATTTANLVGFGGLAGTAPLAYSVRAALAGTGPIVATLAGSAPVAYTNAGALRGLAFAKASTASAYSVQAAPRAVGVLAGTGGFQYAAAPRLLGIAQATGSADYSYTLALRPPGSATLVGVASAGFSISGRAVGIARSAGTSPFTYSATARGISRAWLSGSAGASESAQARLAAVGRLVGVANAASFTTARLYGTAAIYGAADATVTATGALINGIIPLSYPPWSGYIVQLAYRRFTVAAPVRTFTVQWSMQMERFDPLDSRETAVLTFDATPALAAGETLTSATPVTAMLLRGQSNAPLPTLTGTIVTTAQIDPANATAIAPGCAVQVKVTGGQSGCVYALSTTVQTTNAAKVLELKGALPVQDT